MTNGGEKSMCRQDRHRISILGSWFAEGVKGLCFILELFDDANGIGGFVLIAMCSLIRIEMIRPVSSSRF
ncbi:unnamed protein product [Fusarium venenatum]|uniref:Uncharacterized protein n=1 Tax=Fusarium venenatum TaxID=56646 RepID=A0A2L2TE29_9HYPO|nr:LOW QUALITY PROTEIN: uncharacterized protein FVRRES_07093 [Fusarium venenatum]CEI62657.1 unnamed protein product [Fusarium venenatum]